MPPLPVTGPYRTSRQLKPIVCSYIIQNKHLIQLQTLLFRLLSYINRIGGTNRDDYYYLAAFTSKLRSAKSSIKIDTSMSYEKISKSARFHAKMQNMSTHVHSEPRLD